MAPTIEAQLETQVKLRERYFQRVQVCYDLIKVPKQEREFLVRCSQLQETQSKFERVTDEIDLLNTQLPEGVAPTDTIAVWKSFEELFFRIKAHEAQIKEKQQVTQGASSSQAPQTVTTTKLKLPTLTIPTFSGDVTMFSPWKSLYDEIVHLSNQLSDIQKFSYLKSYLQGPALAVIETISFCATNYPLAYRTLVERFSKKRLIATTHMNKILQFQPQAKDTVSSLSSFLDDFCNNVESLRGLNLPDFKEFVLTHHSLSALDPKTRMEFETENANVAFPTYDSVVNFVKTKRSVLEVYSLQSGTSTSSPGTSSGSKGKFTPKMLVANVNSNPISNHRNTSNYTKWSKKCCACGQESHRLSVCPKFQKMSSNQRYNVVKQAKLCFACFSSMHGSAECNSVFKCRSCGSAMHHTLLHPDYKEPHQPPVQVEGCDKNSSQLVSGVMQSEVSLEAMSEKHSWVLLGTATIRIQDSMGMWVSTRCVIDPGSQISAVSEKLAQALNLPRRPSSLQISGIGSANSIRAKGELTCDIQPHSFISAEGFPLQISAVVLPKITSDLSSQLPCSILDRFANLKLADISYVNEKKITSIDMLIGAEYYADLMLSTLPVIPGCPAAIPSRLGWLLMGRVSDQSTSNPSSLKCTSLMVSNNNDPIAAQLERFWELENICDVEAENPEDLVCEQHFVDTHYRTSSGAYVVRLPFRTENPNLGTNRTQAMNRLLSLKKKLERNSKSKELYCNNLKDYVVKGHMVPAASPSSSYFLIHHGVCKESSSTTKLRVVFDPNVKGSNQVSLADTLMVGPKLQKDIGDLLVTFRLNAVALTCDIQGMYRSIGVTLSDRKYQHIMWFDEKMENIQEFELTTVTFGLPPSPFQAQRVLKQLVLDEGSKYPLAAPVILDEIYVDDVVTGGQCVSDVIKLRNELISLLAAGGFSLRKFASSHSEVLSDLSSELCEISHDFSTDETIKLLGVKWCPTKDVFFYTVNHQNPEILTKRNILSLVASIYDLNGYLSPVTVWMKIFLQSLWLDSDKSWDTPVSSELEKKWRSYSSELPALNEINLPRYISNNNIKTVDLVGFSDASGAAYAAVVYLRVCDSNGEIITHLIRAKTKVAPLKVQTINRLELCAALLLAKVIKSLKFLNKTLPICNIHLFSDSFVVLSWLKTPPHQLKTYVANRVSQILDLTNPAQWRHVKTKCNSADAASRGLRPSQLVNNGLWFRGPSFLKLSSDLWPPPIPAMEMCVPELKTTKVMVAKVQENSIVQLTIEKYSSLEKLKRVMAYVLRFVNNTNISNRRLSGHVSVQELDNALEMCIKVTQSCYLAADVKAVKQGLPCSSYLRALSPIMHSTGILAVGGRLHNAPISEGAKHPMLIPKKCHLAILLVRYYHELTLHGGPKLVQSLLQQHYWIIGARNLIRSQLSKCVKCIKLKPVFQQPVMADLPISRFAQGRAFINTGVDMAGPFTLKSGPRRNSPLVKAYFCIFICMATKAMHLELVSSLSTEAFLGSLDRFISRRGLPSCVYSDNGTNFKGAANYQSEVQNFLLQSSECISNHLRNQHISWAFIPPNAPNFGGLWEAGVKSVKSHLKQALGDQSYNYEEFYTFLVRVEAILNSRPLCGLNPRPDDGMDVLTPGHFLIGAPLLARPDQDLTETYIPPVKRWLLISQATQCFWKRWKDDYLNTLIQRTKWTSMSMNLKINDVVLIQNQNCPLQQWPLGIVTRLMPGDDGIVRVARIRTNKGEIVRPVSKLALLPVQDPQ